MEIKAGGAAEFIRLGDEPVSIIFGPFSPVRRD